MRSIWRTPEPSASAAEDCYLPVRAEYVWQFQSPCVHYCTPIIRACQPVFLWYSIAIMKWLLFAVLLSVPQIPPPVRGKAPNSAIGGINAVADKAQSDKTPTAPPAPPLNLIPADQDQNITGTPQTKNAEQSVTVSKLPAVSVRRDWADWVLWVFDCLLVL